MRLRLVLVLAVLVVAPLVSLAWLGTRLARDRRAEVTARFTGLVEARLAQTAATVERLMGERERELLAATETFPDSPVQIRRLARRARAFGQVLVLDPKGQLLFPPLDGDTSAAERQFLERTRGLWETSAFKRLPDAEKGDTPRLHGWHIWYWGGGLNLMYWRRQPDGRMVVVEVDRVRLLADLVAVLPITADGGADERTALLDSSGQIVYQWGEWGPPSGDAPQLERPLAAPLQAWRLAWWGVTQSDPASGLGFNLLAGLLAVGLALVGLAAWFYRESARDLRRASRRVSFVNQVSHELKTPLTNIRMYAELLEAELTGEDERSERYVRVIVQEAQRLSRLIGNVLTFARHQREQLEVRPTPGVVDDLVRGVLEQFEPSLTAAGVSARLDAAAPARVLVDQDALGQILGNLLGNVEKYAAVGGVVEVRTAQHDGFSEVRVVDGGPGIPRAHRGRVFEPFHRISDAVVDGVTGTGIGLGIARDLARMHGGDLTLEPSDAGASFLVRIRTRSAGETA